MNDSRPIEAEVRGTGEGGATHDGGGTEEGALRGVSEELFKEALSYHAAGVTVVAIRDGKEVHATTVSSFIPVSASPPRVLVSVGGNAQVLPFLEEGRRFVVNLLEAGQRRLASVFADSFPVGPSPFPEGGEPEIPGALVSLRCRATTLMDTDGGLVVLARVEAARLRGEGTALIHYRRGYHALEEDRD
ncbi:MAG: flavin reductase family protein [Longimicrobiales bacterium]|nr:flavin reductase family protein [Longimicrobiales bacterium]